MKPSAKLRCRRRATITLWLPRLITVQSQKILVQLADRLQGLLRPVIALQSLAHLRDLLRPQAQLAVLCARIVHVENPLRITLATRAFGTTTAVKGGAFEQGAAQNIAGLDEGGGKSISFPGGVPTCHPYR